MSASLYDIPNLGTPEYRSWIRELTPFELRFLWNRRRAVPIFDEDRQLKSRLDAAIWPSTSCLSIVGYEPTTPNHYFEILTKLIKHEEVFINSKNLDLSPVYWLLTKDEMKNGRLEWTEDAAPTLRAAFSGGVPFAPAFGEEIQPVKDTAPVPLRDKPVAWIGFKVTDSAGNPVPNVQLEVVPPNTDKAKNATTAANGTVDVLQLQSGNCSVSSTAKGQPLKNVLNIGGNAGKNNDEENKKPKGNGPFYLAKVDEYKVKTGDTLQSIAEANGLTFRELAQFNWNTSAAEEINNHLRDDVGCSKKTDDGKNYILDDSDEPGIILVPTPWEMQGSTYKVHVLKVNPVFALQKLRYVSIHLHDHNGQELKNVDYILIIGDPDTQNEGEDKVLVFEGSAKNGVVEQQIPMDAAVGILQYWPLGKQNDPDNFILSELQLEPSHELSTIPGQKTVLNNLNYYQGDIDNTEDEYLNTALDLFKQDFEITQADDNELRIKLENPR